MSFIWPAMLLLLVAIPLGVLGYLRLEQGRRQRAVATGFPIGMPEGGADRSVRPSRLRRSIPAALVVAGLAILAIGLARPQAVVGVPRVEGTVVLAFDVSGSMAAKDLDPTRMEAAKAAARKFVEKQPPSVLVGVVAFSDSGFSTQVPTRDQSLVIAAINRLRPERGTSIGRGIQESLAVIAAADEDPAKGFYSNRSPEPTPEPTPVPVGVFAPAAIVLLTDGENTAPPDPAAAAQIAADRGVRIHAVGIGTEAGTTLEVNGFMVHSQLDAATLQRISDMTGGSFYAASDAGELASVYDNLDTRLVIRQEAMEVTSLVAGVGALILIVGAATSLLWLGRAP
jgi:Ca-activated chloride channel family protein